MKLFGWLFSSKSLEFPEEYRKILKDNGCRKHYELCRRNTSKAAVVRESVKKARALRKQNRKNI